MKLYGKELPELDADTLAELRRYAYENGRYWKATLRDEWMRASTIGPLQALRNSHGPSWLTRYKLPVAVVNG